MTPPPAKTQSPEEIYALLRVAATRKQPVAAIDDSLPRLLCPHLLGRSKDGHLRALCSLEAAAAVAFGVVPMDGLAGAALRWTSSAKSRCKKAAGGAKLTPVGRVASSKSMSIPMLSRSRHRKTDSEAVAVTADGPV